MILTSYMFRKLLLSLLSIFIFIEFLAGQPTITYRTFPTSADILHTEIDSQPDLLKIDVFSPGENLFWDWSKLTQGNYITTPILDPSEGQFNIYFPQADYMIRSKEESEVYYSSNLDSIAELGRAFLDPLTRSFMVYGQFTNPYCIRQAPMDYLDNKKEEGILYAGMPIDSMPDSIMNVFSVPPDSLRLVIKKTRTDTADSWGQMKIKDRKHDILRVKSLRYTNIIIEAKYPFLEWVDATSIVIDAVSSQTTVGTTDTAVVYIFYSDDSVEPIASALMDSTTQNPAIVEFKSYTSITDNASMEPQIYLGPNPVSNEIIIFSKNHQNRSVILELFSIDGRLITSHNIRLNCKAPIIIPDLHIGSGIKIYTLKTLRGQILNQGKLTFL